MLVYMHNGRARELSAKAQATTGEDVAISARQFAKVMQMHGSILTHLITSRRMFCFNVRQRSICRTFVSLVPTPYVRSVIEAPGKPLHCQIIHNGECSCWVGRLYNQNPELKVLYHRVQVEVHQAEYSVAQMEEFQNLKEFAVVFQPFTTGLSVSSMDLPCILKVFTVSDHIIDVQWFFSFSSQNVTVRNRRQNDGLFVAGIRLLSYESKGSRVRKALQSTNLHESYELELPILLAPFNMPACC